MAITKNKALLDRLDEYLSQIQSIKQAEDDQGDKETSHPSKDVDNQTVAATEGARSAENTADVKKNVPGDSVDAAAENSESNAPVETIGVTAAPTGEDSANEKNYSASIDDPGTSSEMTADDGEKFGCDMSLSALTKLANEINAQVAIMGKSRQQSANKTVKKAEVKPGNESEFKAAGYKAASAVCAAIKQSEEEQIKQAAEYEQHVVGSLTKQAQEDAENLIGFLKASFDEEEIDPAAAEQAMAEGGVVDGGAGAGVNAGVDAGDAGDAEIEAIAEALAEAGIDPEVLAEIPPEVLEQAIAEIEGGGVEEAPEEEMPSDLSALVG